MDKQHSTPRYLAHRADLPFTTVSEILYALRKMSVNIAWLTAGGVRVTGLAIPRAAFSPARRSDLRFERPGADLAGDSEAPLVVLDGAAVLAQPVVGVAQVAERIAFAPTVPYLTGVGEGLLVKLDGAPGSRPGRRGPGPGSRAPRLRPAGCSSGGKRVTPPRSAIDLWRLARRSPDEGRASKT